MYIRGIYTYTYLEWVELLTLGNLMDLKFWKVGWTYYFSEPSVCLQKPRKRKTGHKSESGKWASPAWKNAPNCTSPFHTSLLSLFAKPFQQQQHSTNETLQTNPTPNRNEKKGDGHFPSNFNDQVKTKTRLQNVGPNNHYKMSFAYFCGNRRKNMIQSIISTHSACWPESSEKLREQGLKSPILKTVQWHCDVLGDDSWLYCMELEKTRHRSLIMLE